MTLHRNDYKKWLKNNYSNVSSYRLFEKYGVENCKICLIELAPCVSSDELKSRESYYIRTLKCVNKVIPDRKIEEYEQTKERKEKKNQAHKKYIQTEKGYMKEQELKGKYKENMICECGCTIQLREKNRHEKTKKHKNFITVKTSQQDTEEK